MSTQRATITAKLDVGDVIMVDAPPIDQIVVTEARHTYADQISVGIRLGNVTILVSGATERLALTRAGTLGQTITRLADDHLIDPDPH